jgi:hypothetical protein
MPPGGFVVYTRDDCGLCEEFIAELSRLEVAFEVRDVDADPEARRRFGLKVPVLTAGNRIVCHGRLDPAAVLRAARA